MTNVRQRVSLVLLDASSIELFMSIVAFALDTRPSNIYVKLPPAAPEII